MSRNRQRFYNRVEPDGRHGPKALNTMGMAISRATLLTDAEQTHLLQPATEGFERMRRGQATDTDWVHLVTVCAIGLSIEDGGVVTGLHEVLTEADHALATIAQRANASGTGWRAPTLYASEIDQLQTLLRMHAFQLSQVTWGEHRRAWKHAAGSVMQRGGQTIKALGAPTATAAA
jgi:hypothetical protein